MANESLDGLHAVRLSGGRQLFLDVPDLRITIPESESHEVSRGAVIRRWQEPGSGSDGSVVRAVMGPAGTGKTTLLAEHARFLEAVGHGVAWLSASVADNIIEHLRWSAAAALGKLPGANLELDPEVMRRTSLSDLLVATRQASSSGAPSMHVFIDDIHLLDSAAAVAELSEMWRWAPADVHFYLAGFFEPPGLLSRSRLTGSLHTVDASTDLPFSVDEVAEVCAQQGIQFTPAALQTIHRETLGWPAAIRLVMLRALDQATSDDLGTEAAVELLDAISTDLTLTDYVSEIGAGDRQVLRDLAVVDSLTDELVEVIAPGTGALALLAHLRERGLPITFAEDGSAISLHPLLLRALRAESWLSFDRTRLAGGRAADWLASRNRPELAVRAAIRGCDATTVREMIERTAPELILTADLAEIIGLVGELPDDSPGFDVIRALRVALECISGQPSAATDYVTDIPAAVDDDAARLLSNAVVVTYAAIAHSGAGAMFAAAAESLHELSRSSSSDACRAAALLYEAVAASACGDMVRAEAALTDGIEFLRIARLDRAGGVFDYLYACVLGWSGRYRKCVDALDTAEKSADRFGLPPQFDRVAELARAAAAYSRHLLAPDPVEASLAERGTEPTVGVVDRLIAGSPTGIVIDAGAVWPPMLASIAVETTWRLVNSSRPVDAHHYVSGVEERLGRTAETLVSEAIVYDSGARSRHAPKALAGALELCEPAAAGAHTRVWAHLMLARIARRAGDSAAVFRHALAAAQCAEPERILAPFTMFDEVPGIFSTNVGRFGSAEEFVSIIRSTKHRPSSARLSPTELEVLRDLPSWRSVEEIAADRHVSVNTVKSQLRSVYRKLSVSTRRDAIAAGHRDGLI